MSKMSIKSAFLRLVVIVVCVCIVDTLLICFYSKPFVSVAIISSLIPLFVVCLIVIPGMQKNGKRPGQSGK